MPQLQKEAITSLIVPQLAVATKDDIPNVKFVVRKIIQANRQYIDSMVFNNQFAGPLKEMAGDADKDVANFAKIALETTVS